MPAQYVRAAIRSQHTSSGTEYVNVIHVEVDSFTSGPDYDQAAHEIWDRISGGYIEQLTTGMHCLDLTVTTEDYVGAVPAQGQHVVNLPGTRAITNEALSQGLCQLISWKTATPKRYARGHTFMPPGLDTFIASAGGQWDSSKQYWFGCKAFADSYSVGWSGSSGNAYAPIVFSRTRVKLNQTPYQFPITGYRMDPKQHFLRSRLTAP